jgi:hypothetical protein
MRIAGKIAVAEGVSVNFRFDATESDENSSNAVAWGGTKNGYAPYSQRRGDIQFDKAYLQFEKAGFTVAAGQMYFAGFGTGRLVDAVGTGFTVKYGAFTAHWIAQYDENNGNDSFAPSNSDEDRDLYAAKYVFKGEGWSVTPMASYVTGDVVKGQDFDQLGLGVMGNTTLGPVALKGEFNYFDGENTNIDLKGFQLYLDGSMAATDTLRVGLMGFYATGYTDSGEVQVTAQSMPIFADWHPESYGYWSTEFPAEFMVYDPAGSSGGVTAIQIYADLKATDTVSMKFAAMYFAPEDDKNLDYDGYTLNAGIAYKVAANTTLTSHLNYLSMSDDTNDLDKDVVQIISGIQVKF